MRIPAVSFKANAARRHRIPKQRYRGGAVNLTK
jgi:hypothetical protein